MQSRQEAESLYVRSSVFLGLAVNSVSFKARLSVGWEGSFRASLSSSSWAGQFTSVCACSYLGLCRAILVALAGSPPQERLPVFGSSLDPVCHGAQRVVVTPEWDAGLHH